MEIATAGTISVCGLIKYSTWGRRLMSGGAFGTMLVRDAGLPMLAGMRYGWEGTVKFGCRVGNDVNQGELALVDRRMPVTYPMRHKSTIAILNYA